MKYKFIMMVFCFSIYSGLTVYGDETVCTPWSESNGVSCIFGDGENGTNWTRTCSYGSTTCTPRRPAPGNIPCQATTICMGTQNGDVTDPNDLQSICTPWRRAEFQSIACNDGRQSRWVRACTMERLLTKVCSIDQPPNSP